MNYYARLAVAVNAAALAAAISAASSGLVLEYVLPSGGACGKGEGGCYGSSRLLWGMNRHEWGEWHSTLAMIFLAVVAAHVLLHWRWIKSMVRGPAPAMAGRRTLLAAAALALLLGLAAAPFLSPVSGGHHGNRREARFSPDEGDNE